MFLISKTLAWFSLIYSLFTFQCASFCISRCLASIAFIVAFVKIFLNYFWLFFQVKSYNFLCDCKNDFNIFIHDCQWFFLHFLQSFSRLFFVLYSSSTTMFILTSLWTIVNNFFDIFLINYSTTFLRILVSITIVFLIYISSLSTCYILTWQATNVNKNFKKFSNFF